MSETSLLTGQRKRPLLQIPECTTKKAKIIQMKKKFRNIPYLMFNTTFPLNISCSKEVVVGLDPSNQNFTAYVQLLTRTPRGRFGVCLQISDWRELMSNVELLDRYFGGRNTMSFEFGRFIGIFRTIYGQQTFVITEKMPSHPYENDSFAINFMTWQGLMESRYCIDESLTIACLTADSVVFQYEKLGEYVMDHLKQLDEVPEEDLKKAVSTFLRDFPSKDDAYYYITRNISLYCIPLYVSQFKLRNLVNKFDGDE